MKRNHSVVAGVLTGATLSLISLPAQQPDHWTANFGRASQVLIPQSHGIARAEARRGQAIRIEAVRAVVSVLDATATTELDILLRNPAGRQEEAVLLLPVPRGAAVGGFDFQGSGDEASARVLPAAEARRTYDSIVRRLRDPALLEFAGHDLVRTSVFPVPAGGTQRVRLRYEHLLERDGARVDYELPSGSFRLSYLLEDGDRLTASLFAYPDPSVGGGYFLLMAGLPQHSEAEKQSVCREVTIVLGRSGSMSGGKLDQARAAAQQVIEGLDAGESFQIIDYSSSVARFAPVSVSKTEESVQQARAYLRALKPSGGTNIHDALVEALRAEPAPGSLGIVLFLTDGLPTVGQTAEKQIRNVVERGNPHDRRVFTFGVGHDVNAPLLDHVAETSRATSTYVQPAEDVELKVGQVFDELYGPVLSGIELKTLSEDGREDTRRIREQQPTRIRDLFEDDQLVILDRYVGGDPLHFRLAGDWFGRRREFSFRFDLNRATTRNAFVPRLWASRRIAELVDVIRQAGADGGGLRVATGSIDPFRDQGLGELREEILSLSAKFGVLSEYTAFLATEGSSLEDWGSLVANCGANLTHRAMNTRWGIAATNQALNTSRQRRQTVDARWRPPTVQGRDLIESLGSQPPKRGGRCRHRLAVSSSAPW